MKQRRADAIDKEFIKETYGDPVWSPEAIAEKLDLGVQTVYRWGSKMGLSRTSIGITPRLDWRQIWLAYTERGTITEAAKVTGYRRAAVKYAIVRMEYMTAKQRRDTWARYERMPLSTK